MPDGLQLVHGRTQDRNSWPRGESSPQGGPGIKDSFRSGIRKPRQGVNPFNPLESATPSTAAGSWMPYWKYSVVPVGKPVGQRKGSAITPDGSVASDTVTSAGKATSVPPL